MVGVELAWMLGRYKVAHLWWVIGLGMGLLAKPKQKPTPTSVVQVPGISCQAKKARRLMTMPLGTYTRGRQGLRQNA